MTTGSKDLGASSGSRASAEPTVSALTGFDPERIPEARQNYELSIGIINPYGDLWTYDAFPNAEDAEKHLRDFWGKDADAMAPQFSLCVARVEIIPESEPFPLPSAIAAEARRAVNAEGGAVHEGAGRDSGIARKPSDSNGDA